MSHTRVHVAITLEGQRKSRARNCSPDNLFFFCRYFKSAGLSIDIWSYMEDSQFTYQSAVKCVREMKIVTALLCYMFIELDEAYCISFDKDLRSRYFSLCCRGLIEDLIKAVDSISNLKWSGNHIYQMLILYEANADVLRAFRLPVRSDRIFSQMLDNFKRVIDEIKCLICDKLNGSECAIMYVRVSVGHPATDFLIGSIKLFKNHRLIVHDIFVGDRTSSLSSLLSEVISCWAKELKEHSDPKELEKCSVPYPEGARFIFLLNNLTHFVEETTSLLNVLISSDESAKILQQLKLLIKKYVSEYLEKCWGPIQDLVKLNSGEKPCLSSLVLFTSHFDDICMCHGKWVLQTKLKKQLQNKIHGFIVPYYKAFLEGLPKNTQKKYKTAEELEIAMDGAI